ncbi:MAG: TIGR04084 family radical SAM/SPASM domain-containing protein [Candidatus Thorarchaeota archaeon]
MNYHIVLTRRCNLNCRYCHGGEEIGPQTEVTYDIADLARFLSQDPEPVLLFYGGEPTLRPRLMAEIMDSLPSATCMLQTNSLMLDSVPEKYIHRLHSILVSIDGPRELTDYYRAQGVYDRVISSVRWLRRIGYRGDIVARMTVSEQTDIYEAVSHLLRLRNPHFDHVHWQLNVVWSAEDNWSDFDGWLHRSYMPGITRLVDDWVEAMRSGTVMGIVPFIPVMYSILTDTPSGLRCGSGLDTFAIHVNGSIGVCPISPDWDFSIVGDIRSTRPQDLRNIMPVTEPCPSCEEFWLCGGRCLFANKQRLWGESGFAAICESVKHMLAELKTRRQEVQGLIDDGTISLSDFEYPEYNNGCEVIP